MVGLSLSERIDAKFIEQNVFPSPDTDDVTRKILDSFFFATVKKSNPARMDLKDSEKIPPELIKKLQAELIYLGMESLIQGQTKDREFGSLTVCLTEAEFEKLKFDRIQI